MKGWQRKVTFPHNKDLDWTEYNPREKSFSFWGEDSNPEATGQGVPVALILGDSPTSLFFRGRVQDDLRLDQVGLAAWRLFVCLKDTGQVGILWTFKRLSQNSINIHISSILWHPDKSSDPRHCPWTYVLCGHLKNEPLGPATTETTQMNSGLNVSHVQEWGGKGDAEYITCVHHIGSIPELYKTLEHKTFFCPPLRKSVSKQFLWWMDCQGVTSGCLVSLPRKGCDVQLILIFPRYDRCVYTRHH